MDDGGIFSDDDPLQLFIDGSANAIGFLDKSEAATGLFDTYTSTLLAGVSGSTLDIRVSWTGTPSGSEPMGIDNIHDQRGAGAWNPRHRRSHGVVRSDDSAASLVKPSHIMVMKTTPADLRGVFFKEGTRTTRDSYVDSGCLCGWYSQSVHRRAGHNCVRNWAFPWSQV